MYLNGPLRCTQQTHQMYTTEPSDVHNRPIRCTQRTPQMYTIDPSDVHNGPSDVQNWPLRCTQRTPHMYWYTTDPSDVHNGPLIMYTKDSIYLQVYSIWYVKQTYRDVHNRPPYSFWYIMVRCVHLRELWDLTLKLRFPSLWMILLNISNCAR